MTPALFDEVRQDGEADPRFTPARPAAGWSPISQALRDLGVTAGGYYDEFDAIRLGRHRDTEDWIPARPPS